ncbi:MAG: hypothetical protein UT34_C0001G0366 [candidate division WS6 bacterium GW2011_GWF2_39_15]|uniref:Uncharacterized protein n=1 Tax=candidate division WS6 bacterium GW2011_GWF2_39_15 TaxID=1619100 RepID=A0A0G0N0G6_9BACT|nr:MAG: hypothetical protein UT34_C0001G0366 [candidate division WS6 bacterium GW2011_GWF2_39_15]
MGEDRDCNKSWTEFAQTCEYLLFQVENQTHPAPLYSVLQVLLEHAPECVGGIKAQTLGGISVVAAKEGKGRIMYWELVKEMASLFTLDGRECRDIPGFTCPLEVL